MRLNPDLLPIKGPRKPSKANWRRVHPARTGSLTLISTSGRGAGARTSPGSLARSFLLFRSLSLSLSLSRSFSALPLPLFPLFSRPFSPPPPAFLRFRRRSNDRDRARRNRRLYGRTPVIGWSRFIDGGISPLGTCLSTTRARRGETRRIDRPRSRFPSNFRGRCESAFLNFRLRSLGNARSFASITPAVARCKLFVFSAQ